MSTTVNALAAGLALAATLAPGHAFAWQKHRESATVVVTKDPQLLNKGPIAPPSFVHPRPLVQPRPFVHRPFGHGGTVIYSAPPVYYAPPTYYYDPLPTYYVPPPATYYPPAASTPPAGSASTPGVIEYPHGRYELHGDGVAAPYTWVWIPNPPPSPPPAVPTAPPAPAAPPEPSASNDASPARPSGPLYRWTDEQGSVYWTDRIDAVPEKYRAGAKQTQPS
jgi:hypothetical protein